MKPWVGISALQNIRFLWHSPVILGLSEVEAGGYTDHFQLRSNFSLGYMRHYLRKRKERGKEGENE